MATFPPALAQEDIKLTIVASRAPVFLCVKTVEEVCVPGVDRGLAAAGGNYKIDWTKAWGGTLVKLGGESKGGVADGVADIGLVSTIFEIQVPDAERHRQHAPSAPT
jgi:hypothetical protein